MQYQFLSVDCRYLTNSLQSVDRFPISFRSTFHGSVYRHIVLGLHAGGRYGAVGLSRRDDLMYKPLKYAVSDLIKTGHVRSKPLSFCHSLIKYWSILKVILLTYLINNFYNNKQIYISPVCRLILERCRKCAVRWSWKILWHPVCVATLLCEM